MSGRLWIVPVVLGMALASAWWDQEAGLRAWARLRADLHEARGRIQALRVEIGELEREAAALEEDRFAQEAAIRDALGLVRPGEILVRLPSREAPGDLARP